MMTDNRMRRGATIRQRVGDLLLVLMVATVIWTVVAAVTGGVVVRGGGLSLTSRDPWRPLLAALVLGSVGFLTLGRERFFARVRPVVGTRARRPVHVAAFASVGAFVLAVAWSTRAAGGSDSSCYVLQAQAFAQGRVSLAPVLTEMPPGVTPAALAPIGFIASPAAGHEAVPICASGLALMMAPVMVLGRDVIFLVVPVFAGLMVWWTFAFARQVVDAGMAACAAILVGCSPIFLYQAVQPMSDVPAAALFMGALVFALRRGRANAFSAGVLASLAVLTRPNLALVIAPLVLLLGNGDSPGFPENRDCPGFSKSVKRGQSRFWWFVAGGVPAAIAMGALNAARYGGPLASGYGESGDLFAWAHIVPNMARYPRWLIETQSPLILLALGGPLLLWARGQARVALATTLSLGALFATYLAYTVFDDWWYLRFLVPGLPLLIVFMTVAVFAISTRVSPAHGRTGAMVICALLMGWSLDIATRRHAMDLWSLEARFRVTGDYAARALPPTAIVLAVQHTGSVRFYAGKPTLAWDGIDPTALDRVIDWLNGRGLAPVIVLEDAEEQRFRERFATQSDGRLDWPPATEIHGRVRVRIYNPSQRLFYERGQPVQTEHIR
jgi:hypothetical protein